MTQLKEIPFSVLDLAPIVEGGTISQSFQNTLDLAQHVEKWGYRRFWLAEHHNMPFIGSSATSVLISYVANGTSTIRVGSGGIMLPNHSPLVIAEQFGTLESLFPGRIDLGLGRAPGTDQLTAQALRRNSGDDGHNFPQQLTELRAYFDPSILSKPLPVRAFPGHGLKIPIWLLGSSGFSAQLAGQLGLPFAFASHFSPKYTVPALEIYRNAFQPSDVLDEPYAIVCLNVIAAETDEEADYLSTSLQQQFLNLIRRTEKPLQPPVENFDDMITVYEKSALEEQLGSSIFGSKETVTEKLTAFVAETEADEIMVNGTIYDHEKRLRSFELIAEIFSS